MPTKRSDLSIPYQNEPHMRGAKWFVDERTYPEGFNTHEFPSRLDAEQFIEGTPL